jgi:hypothetical protein
MEPETCSSAADACGACLPERPQPLGRLSFCVVVHVGPIREVVLRGLSLRTLWRLRAVCRDLRAWCAEALGQHRRLAVMPVEFAEYDSSASIQCLDLATMQWQAGVGLDFDDAVAGPDAETAPDPRLPPPPIRRGDALPPPIPGSSYGHFFCDRGPVLLLSGGWEDIDGGEVRRKRCVQWRDGSAEWVYASEPAYFRQFAAAVTLHDGRILVMGGVGGRVGEESWTEDGVTGTLASAEILTDGSWAEVAPIPVPVCARPGRLSGLSDP